MNCGEGKAAAGCKQGGVEEKFCCHFEKPSGSFVGLRQRGQGGREVLALFCCGFVLAYDGLGVL